MQDYNKAFEILNSTERSYSDLEFLAIYLMCLEDYRNYAKNLSSILQIQLVRSIEFFKLSKKSVLFKKGDLAETWFVVYEGELNIINQVGSEQKILKIITKGKQTGEREVLRQKSYPSTCVSKQVTWVLGFPKSAFINLIGSQLDKRLRVLRNFVHTYIPLMSSFSWNFKEKVGYSMGLLECKRGESLIEKDALDDKIYFVIEGEVAVTSDVDNRVRDVIRLGLGNSFAEECAILGKPSFYHIRVSSERATIAYMNRLDVFRLPDQSLDKIKKNLQDKIWSREGIIKTDVDGEKHYETPSPAFKGANRRAREKLMEYILRNRPATPRKMMSLSRARDQRFKDFLQNFRDCSPNKIQFRNGFYSHRSFTNKAVKKRDDYMANLSNSFF